RIVNKITFSFIAQASCGPFPILFLPGVCMAFHESSFDTHKVGQPNRNGSRDYGIFWINSPWWCNNYQGLTANVCNNIDSHNPCSVFFFPDLIYYQGLTPISLEKQKGEMSERTQLKSL
uniref:Lysozyme n=1 Tax=Pseudonaja textilis TaxID=8673 RepID=A0A670ZE16_PSETE